MDSITKSYFENLEANIERNICPPGNKKKHDFYSTVDIKKSTIYSQ